MLKSKLESVPTEGHYGGSSIELAAVFDKTSSMFSKNAPYRKITSQDFTIPVEVATQELNDEFDLGIEEDTVDDATPCTKLIEGVTGTARKAISRPVADSKRKWRLSDRDIFSHLCYRNFAHMAAIPFIQSVQRVTYLKGQTQSQVEKMLADGSNFDSGVLWEWYSQYYIVSFKLRFITLFNDDY